MKHVIIGAGAAGITAAKTIKEIDKDAEVVVIGDELFLPYKRYLLTEFLCNSIKRDELLFFSVEMLNELGIKFLTWVTNILFFTDYTDVATCYKLMRTDLLKSLTLRSNNFDLDFELCAIFKKKKWKVGEIKIDYISRTFEEGRQMQPFKSGFSAMWTIIRERFTN